MTKRRAAIDPGQLGFTFEPPPAATQPADLAGLDRVIASTVGRALKEDPRSRPEVAGAMSALLDEEIGRFMLDAYASEARDTHNISAARFLALIAATGRFDLLDSVMRRIGAAVLVGEQIHTARVGDLRCRLRAMQAELTKLERMARPIGGEG